MLPPPFIVSTLDFHIRHMLSLISLCALLWEYVGTWQFEFTYIWSRPLTISKALFVISRYYEITNKAVHYSLIHLILGRSPSGVSPQRCAIWFIFMFSGNVIIILILDIILFLRVYALYRTKRLILLLLIPLSSPYIFGAYNTYTLWVIRHDVFDGTCNVITHAATLKIMIALGVSFIISHLIIWICGYAKRNIGDGQVPVVRLVVNESTWVFIFLFAIVAALMPHSIAVKTMNPFLTFVCPTTLISILNCRIIQNMHNLTINERARNVTCDDQDFQLTTFIHTEFDP